MAAAASKCTAASRGFLPNRGTCHGSGGCRHAPRCVAALKAARSAHRGGRPPPICHTRPSARGTSVPDSSRSAVGIPCTAPDLYGAADRRRRGASERDSLHAGLDGRLGRPHQRYQGHRHTHGQKHDGEGGQPHEERPPTAGFGNKPVGDRGQPLSEPIWFKQSMTPSVHT